MRHIQNDTCIGYSKVSLTLGCTNKLTPPPWYKGREVDGTPPWVFVMLPYFKKISLLVESL